MFEADRQSGSHRWPVVRLRAGSKTEVVLLSSQFFSITTHWIGHTVPCAIDDCDLCELLPQRGLFYLAGMVNSRVHLVELGSQSASLLEQHAKLLNGGMKPGQVYELARFGAKHPVRSEVIRFQEGAIEISMLSLAAHAMALYRFPCPNPGEQIHEYAGRLQKLAQRRNVQAALEFKARKIERA